MLTDVFHRVRRLFNFILILLLRHMGSYMPGSEDLSPFQEGGYCYAGSLIMLINTHVLDRTATH